jgi:hypothetical protein
VTRPLPPRALDPSPNPPRRCRQISFWFAVPAILTIASAAQAIEIPISGTYGTIAICIMDAFTDVPSGDVNINAGGAPLARVIASEFDTPADSCAFQRLVSESAAGPTQTWTVEADCSGKATISVSDKIGTVLVTVDQCNVPYAERLTRELQRMPVGPKK